MDIDALRTFVEVNRTRHFGQAASNLYVTQSTVSARIRVLESYVGVPLFVRERNNIQLTPAGHKLLRYAENILTTWTRACQEISIADEELTPFVVGATPSLWDSLLQGWMSFLLQQFPTVVLNAEVQSPELLVRRVCDKTMDMAFAFDIQHGLDCEMVEVTRLPLVMVSDQQHASVEAATTSNYILVEWGSSFAMAHARHFPDMPVSRLRVMLGRIAMDYLLLNGGTAYLARPMVEQSLEQGELFIVEDAPVITRSVFAIYATHSDKAELIQQACDYFGTV